MILSDEQLASYQEQGYLIVEGLLSEEQLEQFNQRFLQFVNGQVPLPEAMKIMQDVMVVKGAVDPQTPVHGVNKLLCLENDPVLFAYARAPAVVAVVQQLLGEQAIYSLSSNVFNKPPGVDGRHPMHQDLRYFKLRPADKIIGTWTALLPATREAGCLAVLPGSHKGEFLDHDNPGWEYVNHGFFGIDNVDLTQRVHVPLQPGDTLFFHPLLIHGSGRNRSADFRRAISVHYGAASCQSPKGDWHDKGLFRAIA